MQLRADIKRILSTYDVSKMLILMITSFLFLIPAYLAFQKQLRFLGALFCVLFVTSVVNHTDKYKFIEPIDQNFCWIFGLVLFAKSVVHKLYIPIICAIISASLFFIRSRIFAHVLLHIVSTIGFVSFVLDKRII